MIILKKFRLFFDNPFTLVVGYWRVIPYSIKCGSVESPNLLGIYAAVLSWNSLSKTAGHRMKAVELANVIRSDLGTHGFSELREHFGGFLNVLDIFDCFKIHRIPKNDEVQIAPLFVEQDLTYEIMDYVSIKFRDHLRLRSESPPPSKSLYFSELSSECDIEQVKNYLQRYDNLATVVVYTNADRPYGFLNFESVEEADLALKDIQRNIKCQVEFAKQSNSSFRKVQRTRME